MITLGVTGSIGSGKSTACQILDDLGAQVFYADEVAKRLMVEDPELRREIISEFGEESYTADGRLNREFLAEVVFNDAERLQSLNSLVHRRVRSAFEDVRRKAERIGVDLLVEEAALIYEAGIDETLDYVAVVDVPEDVRIRRVMERDNTAPEKIRARMAHQLPADEKRRRADFVLDNSGSVEELRRQVIELYHQLK